jgi:hypothetical protein
LYEMNGGFVEVPTTICYPSETGVLVGHINSVKLRLIKLFLSFLFSLRQ